MVKVVVSYRVVFKQVEVSTILASTLHSSISKNFHTHHNVSVSAITSGPVPGELQDSVPTIFHPSNQEPVLAWINWREGFSFSIAVLQRVVIHFHSKCYVLLEVES